MIKFDEIIPWWKTFFGVKPVCHEFSGNHSVPFGCRFVYQLDGEEVLGYYRKGVGMMIETATRKVHLRCSEMDIQQAGAKLNNN